MVDLSARRVAFDVMQAVRSDDAYANLLLPVRITRAGLSRADAAFATELTYGTLRMLGYYDRVISLAANRPVDAIDPNVLDVLRLGAHQILTLATAVHAAVNESVTLAETIAGRRITGFANAVLRTITRSTAEEWRRRVLASQRDADERLAAVYSHPVWIVGAFRAALLADGVQGTALDDELRALLEADNVPARPALVALPGLASAEPASTSAGTLSPVGRRLDTGAELAEVGGLSAGTTRVQDEGSQLAALALSRCRPIRAGERWLDLCAGPGGKSALLGAEAQNAGAILVANEVSSVRAGLVRSALAPLHPRPEVWVKDGRTLGAEHRAAFDRVLVDAPCTGLGALRRRPESRWRREPSDLTALTALQADLLDSAVESLAPDGILAYVTCSPHVEETRAQVAALRVSHPGLVPLGTSDIVSGIANAPLGGGSDPDIVQLWPHRDGTDAMFIALFTLPGTLDDADERAI